MCLAIPGKIISLNGLQATVAYPHEQRQVMLGGILPKVGDYVLVQMGIVVQIVSSKEAKLLLSHWKT